MMITTTREIVSMPKKTPTGSRVSPRTAGRQMVKIADITQMVQECRERLAAIEAQVKVLEQAKRKSVTELEMDGATQLTQAKGLLGRFNLNLQWSITKLTNG